MNAQGATLGEPSGADPVAGARALRKKGNELLQHGDASAALECFDRALACHPGDAATYSDRGNALQDLRRLEDAVASYDEALRIKPDFPAALTNRSNALRALRRFDESLRDLDAALRLKPAFPEALNSRGCVLRDLGRSQEALESFEAALALKPEFVIAHCNRGNTLLDLLQSRAAFACFDELLRHLPDDGEALFGRASALLQLRESLQLAADDFVRAAERGIERAETLVGQAACLAGLERHREAAACLAELLEIAPDRDYARGSRLHSLLQTCDWAQLSELTEELASLIRQGRRATHPLSLLSLIDSPELQVACARLHVEEKYRRDEALGPCPARSSSDRRLRVAYISADFCDHPVSHLLVGVLEKHDRQAFEVIGVSLQAGQGGALEQRVRGAFDRFIEVVDLTDLEVARLLRELEVDIAVDLMGFTQGLRLGIFTYRCAPVQVSYLGYAGTTGAPYMDYLLADAVALPQEQERHYSERVVRLPGCYLPNDDRREIGAAPTRAEAGLPEREFVFCAFTSAYKLNPPVFDVWMRLLQGVPGSVLWMRSVGKDALENLRREMQRRGVSPDRLVLAPRVANMAAHLGRHALADLYLDTLPYNAHSTACDALWAGVPVLTCAGSSMASRAAASALSAVGLPELITHNLEEYEAKALDLALHPERLKEIRAKLARQRVSSPLFDTERYTRALEGAYRSMHQEVVGAAQTSPREIFELGNKYMVAGEPQRALEQYSRLLALEPRNVPGWYNQGNAQRRLERFDAALQSYDQAIRLNPKIAELHQARGVTLRALGRAAEALSAFERAIELRPGFVDALVNCGNALLDAARPQAALECFDRSLAADPNCLEAHCNRGNALSELRRYTEALESYDRALHIQPNLPQVLANRATALHQLSRPRELIECLEHLCRIAPRYDYALGRLLQARLEICAWDDYPQQLAQVASDLEGGARVIHPFSMLPAIDSPALQLRAARLHAASVEGADAADPLPAMVQPGIHGTGVGAGTTNTSTATRTSAAAVLGTSDKVRVAYVSADLRDHAASYLMAGVFERHDRSRFEITAISLTPAQDSPMGRRVAAAFDLFVDVSQHTDSQIVGLMRDLKIDIAVDLMGYTLKARPGVFARRAAPVQVNYLGFPGTLGAPCIDYILADEFVIPPEQAQHYAEQVVYLPDCFQANDDRCVVGPKPTRAAAGLPDDGLVLCSFNSSFKFNPPVFEIWMHVLRSAAQSTLWLLADREETRQSLLREAAKWNIDPDRLVFAEKIPYADHLGRLALADLFLDTAPYNAGTTASDALRMGVPVLTCAGESFAARMAGSLLRTVGLPDLITHNLADYERKALELTRLPQQLASARATLARNLVSSPLFHTARFCRHLESAYRGMHERSITGGAPASFAVGVRDGALQ
jgi:predicted O-linked N-acetylglucosamine transferase (SPINDLY family)